MRGVDPHRERAKAYQPATDPDVILLGIQLRERGNGGGEVLHVPVRMEADEIGAKQAAQDLLAPGQDAEDLGRRERDMEEEPDPRLRKCRAHHPRNEQELVIVNPYDVAGLVFGDHTVGELLVDLAVRAPRGGGQREPLEQVVEHRPEDAVRELLVVLAQFGVGEKHRDDPALGKACRQYRLGLGRELARGAGPAYP
jgi:hypothetical protein